MNSRNLYFNHSLAQSLGSILTRARERLRVFTPEQLRDMKIIGSDANDPLEKSNYADTLLGTYIRETAIFEIPVDHIDLEDQNPWYRDHYKTGLKLIGDQLDGTKNRAVSPLMPHSGGLAIQDTTAGNSLGNIIASAVIDYVSGTLYLAYQISPGAWVTTINGEVAKTNQSEILDPINQPVIVENYYKKTRSMTNEIFGLVSGNFRSLGSFLLEMCLMASINGGGIPLVINAQQKTRELCITLPIVSGAGARCFDFKTKPLHEYPITSDLKQKIPIILSANGHIREAIFAKLSPELIARVMSKETT